MLIDQHHPPSNSKPIMSLSAYSVQGKRNHMEDFFDVGYQLKPCDQIRSNECPYEYFYLAVFDGHGGSEAAKFAKQNLLNFITKRKEFWSDDDQEIMSAIRMGYAETHSAMREALPSWCRTSRTLPSTAGTTASIIFIKNGKFYTGHVGDSRIVISNKDPETENWIPDQVTTDHKPEAAEEIERIKRAGGEVKSKIGVHRVVWKRPVLTGDVEDKLLLGPKSTAYNECIKRLSSYPIDETLVDAFQTIPFLAIARSLGDFWSINPYTGQYVVSPEPDVSCRAISPDDKCILLATDGLWNVMHTTHAVRMLQELDISKSGKRPRNEHLWFSIDNYYDVAGDDCDNHALSLVYFAYQIWERRRLSYPTRASLQDKESMIQQKIGMKPIQIGQTRSFVEEIRWDREPEFSCYDVNYDMWQRLEKYLIFPPTILEQEYNFKHSKLVYPKNYMRLSVASCRKITHSDSYTDSYIYIKSVSDDPADEVELPTRMNKRGKEVKDASAQATQSIHDFGQPWDQLLDEIVQNDDDEDFDTELVFEHELRPGDVVVEDTELVFRHELRPGDVVEQDVFDDDDDDDDVNNHEEDGDNVELKVTEMFKEPSKEEKSIPQLRCLLNYTPPVRRSMRAPYNSVSENTKRKNPISPEISTQKAKRRKSQPVRCN